MSDSNLFGDIPDPYASTDVPAPIAPQAMDVGPTRAVLARRRTIMLVSAIAVGSVMLAGAWAAPRGELSGSFIALSVGMPAVASLVAWRVASRQGRLGLGATSTDLFTALLGAGALFVLSALGPPAMNDVGFDARSTVVCGGLGAAMGVLPFVFAVLAYRGAFVTNALTRMAAFGIAAGAFAALLLRLHCPHDGVMHVLVGHGAALVLFAALGAVAARLFVARRLEQVPGTRI